MHHNITITQDCQHVASTLQFW